MNLPGIKLAGAFSDNEFYCVGSEYRTLKFTADAEGNIEGMIINECVFSVAAQKAG